jgi:hypothetical protein
VSARESLIQRLWTTAQKSPDYTVGGAEAQIWLNDIDAVEREAVRHFLLDSADGEMGRYILSEERKRIAAEIRRRSSIRLTNSLDYLGGWSEAITMVLEIVEAK